MVSLCINSVEEFPTKTPMAFISTEVRSGPNRGGLCSLCFASYELVDVSDATRMSFPALLWPQWSVMLTIHFCVTSSGGLFSTGFGLC